MEAEMKMKKRVYLGDYTKRRNSPYFSFLSLSREEQAEVKKRHHRCNPEAGEMSM